MGRRVRTLVAVGAVLAVGAGLAGRAPEALSTLAHAGAVQSVQADPVSKADVLGFPRAGLALGAKEAGTALPRLQPGDKARVAGGTPPPPGFAAWRPGAGEAVRAPELGRARARASAAPNRYPEQEGAEAGARKGGEASERRR